MNQGRICVSVCGQTTSDVLDKIRRASEDADVIEIRMDCVEPREIPQLIDQVSKIQQPLLITYRPREQGGYRDLTVEDRLQFWNLVSSKFRANNFLVDQEFDLDASSAFAAE